MNDEWDVAVVGAGPAGLSAATAAARAGARVVVLERAVHPRYKTCGGGLIGTSLATLGAQEVLGDEAQLPVRERVDAATFTLHGKRLFTRRRDDGALLTMVVREEFDNALRAAAVAAGAVVRERSVVRAVGQDAGRAFARLADGTQVCAEVLVGADGSAGVTARYVGVEFCQVDLGLEVELAVSETIQRRWQGRILIDWGPIPGSYGWVFPKAGRLTVGVIATRGRIEQTRAYLRAFTAGLELGSAKVIYDSGHLTKCRAKDSPLRRGRVIVAGDAAGLLEPWTREGISFALRSGSWAGMSAATAALGRCDVPVAHALDRYVESVSLRLVPEMDAGRMILAAFSRHPAVVHAGLATSTGWRVFSKFCRGELALPSLVDRPLLGPAISVLGRSHRVDDRLTAA
jgi:geranylgeranyl reductase family protein